MNTAKITGPDSAIYGIGSTPVPIPLPESGELDGIL